MNPLFAVWLFGAIVTLFYLTRHQDQMLEAGHRYHPPMRYFVLHTVGWMIEWALYAYGSIGGDLSVYKAFNRWCWPGKYGARR